MNGKAVAALIVVLLAGGGLAIASSGGDEDGGADTVVATETTTTSSPTRTETTKEEKEPEKTDGEEIEQVIYEYVEESSDTQTAECDVVLDDVCVQDETGLTVEDIQVKGDQARAELKGGGSFELQRDGDQWKISGFEPSRPDRSGSVDAPQKPERPEAEKPEVEKPERPKAPQG